MRPSLFFLLVSFSLFGCRHTSLQIPAGVLSVDSMTMVMVDLQLAESTLSHTASDSLDKWRNIYTSAVFLKHGISQAIFDSSFRFYQYHPDLMEKMLDQVIILLTKRQTEDLMNMQEDGSEELSEFEVDSIPENQAD